MVKRRATMICAMPAQPEPVPVDPALTGTDEDLLTVDELSGRVGMTVRTLRFYASRGLMPPPVRRGRVGYYGAEHIARLDLVRELQAHGFTLSAIEGYLERIPPDATPQDIALHRTLLTPWMRDLPETLDRTALVRRTGRDLTDDDIELLVALGVVEPTPDEDVFQVATAHLSLGVELIDLDLPVDAVLAAAGSSPSTAARSPRSSPRCSGPWSGRTTATPAGRPSTSSSWSNASSRSPSRAWSSPTNVPSARPNATPSAAAAASDR